MSNRRSDQLLVRYPCGCIGFKPFNDGSAILIVSCDDAEVHFSRCVPGYIKDPDGYKMLGGQDQSRLFNQLTDLVNKGHDMQDVLRVLSRHLKGG